MAIVNPASNFGTLTLQERGDLVFSKLVRLFLHDQLKETDPDEVMKDFFGQWPFGPGLSPSNLGGNPAYALLAPFFGAVTSLLAVDPMWKWSAGMDFVVRYDGGPLGPFQGNLLRDWYTLDELLGEAPWVDRNSYWVRGLRTGNAALRGGMEDFCDSLRQYCRWLLRTSTANITAKFPDLAPLVASAPHSAQRLDAIVEALKVLSTDDWVLLKKNKGWRRAMEQMKARRQWEGGKTEIIRDLLKWSWTRDDVMGNGIFQQQDLLANDKPMATEMTQAGRLLNMDHGDAWKRFNLVFIFGFFGARDTVGLAGAQLIETQRYNANFAHAYWARLATLMRIAGIKSDIDDPESGEPMDPGTQIYAVRPDLWPNVRLCMVSPLWGTMKRTGFTATWNSVPNNWDWTPRTGTATRNPWDDEAQFELWDKIRTMLLTRVDEAQEEKWRREVEKPNGLLMPDDVRKAADKGYWSGLRGRYTYVLAMEPPAGRTPANYRDPVPLAAPRIREGFMMLEDARRLRDQWGAANVVWISGFGRDPGTGFAHWLDRAYDFVDLARLLEDETLNARAAKIPSGEKLLEYRETHIPVCRHEYSESCNGRGNGCEGWRAGDSIIEWMYFVQFKLLAKIVVEGWLQKHGDQHKWEQLVQLLGYPDKAKDPGKADEFWTGRVASGRPLEFIFGSLKGAGSSIAHVFFQRIDAAAIARFRKNYEAAWGQIVRALTGYSARAFSARTPGLEWCHEDLVALLDDASEAAYDEAVRWGELEDKLSVLR